MLNELNIKLNNFGCIANADLDIGKINVVGEQQYSFLKMNDMVICRGINMQFDFRNNASFNRDVVFRFNDNSKKIESIAFRLSSVT